MNKKSQDYADVFSEIERKMSNIGSWIQRYQNLPEKEDVLLHNENRASTLSSEIAQLDETFHWFETVMQELDTAHEWYLCDQDGTCFRHRDSRSIENTEMMFGPQNPCLEDWMAELHNDLLECRNELSVDLSITKKGDTGEDNVFRELYSRYPTLSNIVLDVADEDGATNETDFYAILPHGVAVIEVKNYGKNGQCIWVKEDKSQAWKLTTVHGQHLSDKKNPFYQNERHIKATRKVLKGLLGKEIPLFSVVVLGNNHVKIMNDTDLVVTNPRGLCSALVDLTSDVTLTEQEQGIIMRHLQSLDIGSRSFKCPSYRKRIEHIYQLAKEILPVMITNKDIRTLYYADRKKKNDRLAGVLVGAFVLLPIIISIISGNIGAGFLCLPFLCLVISAMALLSLVLKRFFPKLGMPKRNDLVRMICQEQSNAAASAEPNSREARLAEFNQYLLAGAERYPINFDVKIPLYSLPAKYIPFEVLKEEIAQVTSKSAEYVKEHFGFDDFDIFCLDALYKMTGSELTLGFQMVRHMCSLNVGTFVGLNEAEQHYQKFFKESSMVSACLNINVLQHASWPKVPVENLPLLDEVCVTPPKWCRNSNNEVLIHYGDELAQAYKVLTMLAECHHYAQYLLELGCKYYEHCGVVVNDEGELFEVSDWNQTLENFRELLEADRDYYEITSVDFLNAVV